MSPSLPWKLWSARVSAFLIQRKVVNFSSSRTTLLFGLQKQTSKDMQSTTIGRKLTMVCGAFVRMTASKNLKAPCASNAFTLEVPIRSLEFWKNVLFQRVGPLTRIVFCRDLRLAPILVVESPRHQVVRSVQRFARKYWCAVLLSAKLLQGEAAVNEVMHQIEETALYKSGDKKFKEVIALPTSKLQQWVRGSFLSDSSLSSSMKQFVETVVRPALECNVAAVPEKMADVIARVTAILAGSEANEEDHANLKIACAALTGQLSSHPLIQGLALQCRRLVDKAERGITTMRGRRSAETERERALISDAGLTLALHAGNAALAKEFGLPAASLKISLDILTEQSLPIPALALNWDAVMKQNFVLVDQRYDRCQGAPKRLLAIASVKFFIPRFFNSGFNLQNLETEPGTFIL